MGNGRSRIDICSKKLKRDENDDRAKVNNLKHKID